MFVTYNFDTVNFEYVKEFSLESPDYQDLVIRYCDGKTFYFSFVDVKHAFQCVDKIHNGLKNGERFIELLIPDEDV